MDQPITIKTLYAVLQEALPDFEEQVRDRWLRECLPDNPYCLLLFLNDYAVDHGIESHPESPFARAYFELIEKLLRDGDSAIVHATAIEVIEALFLDGRAVDTLSNFLGPLTRHEWNACESYRSDES